MAAAPLYYTWHAASGLAPKVEYCDDYDGCEGVCRCHETEEMAERDRDIADENESDLEGMDIVVDVEFKNARRWLTIPAVMNTGAFSIWIDAELFKRLGGKLIEDKNGARDAGGRKLHIEGKGYINFKVWGCTFYEQKVRVMKKLPIGVLFGRKFWLKYELQMDLKSISGSISVKNTRFWGTVRLKEVVGESVRATIEDADEDDAITHMDLSAFHPSSKMQEKLRDLLWKHRNIFKGFGCISGYKHKNNVPSNAEPYVARIRRRSSAEMAVGKEMVEYLMSDGILEHSESPWAATNVLYHNEMAE